MNLQCLTSIKVLDPKLEHNRSKTKISITDMQDNPNEFFLIAKYEQELKPEHLPLLRLAAAMPLLNYGLFTKEIRLEYPVSKADQLLLDDLLEVFSKDIFINKLVRRKNPYILPEYIPTDAEVTEENAKPLAKIVPKQVKEDTAISESFDADSCGVLSSGGKESLCTYGILKELGANVHPLYVNESGGHWRTALPAFRHHKTHDSNTGKVWLNVDRFYTFMLDHLKIIRPDHRKIWSDTYPLRLCIFPIYVFYLLPVFSERKIGNLLIGSEFDDPRLSPLYRGIRHYWGVYDQTQDFDVRMERWYQQRMPSMRQWSAVRPVSGLIVEKILTQRYPHLAKLQRSCHSCHIENEKVIPCGECSKCLGILLFLHANKVDPRIMGFKEKDVSAFPARFTLGGLRLDEDEREHAAFLASKFSKAFCGKSFEHVETVHLHKLTCDLELVPVQFSWKLRQILEQYTKGYSELKGETWV